MQLWSPNLRKDRMALRSGWNRFSAHKKIKTKFSKLNRCFRRVLIILQMIRKWEGSIIEDIILFPKSIVILHPEERTTSV